jgi:uncharacterized membrane protein
MNLITLEAFYVIVGIVLLLVAGRIAADAAHPKRWGSALFWALLAVTFLFGRAIPPVVTGYLVLAMVVLAAAKQVGRSSGAPGSSPAERTAHEERLRHRLLWPALLIPATAVAGTLLLARVHFGSVRLIEASQAALISLSLGALFALGLGLWLTKAPVGTPLAEGSRLLQTIGWALILPQLLAALGGIFAQAGVGEVIAGLLAAALPMHAAFVAVLAYCGTMALFTMIMGNAFAAFAVATGGIGLPFIVQRHGGNPAIMAAIGMLSGYCGTLLTPMAANFNIVPTLLLELKDRYAVIKAQAPVAVVIFIANLLLMYFCVYRF